MACNCKKNQEQHTNAELQKSDNSLNVYKQQKEEKIKPTDQCISCTYKHYCEAWCQLTEYGYLNTNRRLVIGNLRAIVLHTFKEWKEIAKLARECSLLVEEVRDDKALEKMELLGGMIDMEFYKANPEIKARLDALKEKHG